MEQSSSIRLGKLLYLGLPFLLLVLYLVWIPSPSVSRIYIQEIKGEKLGFIAEGYDLRILSLTPDGRMVPKSSYNLSYQVKDLTIVNDMAYVTTGNTGLHIIDIHAPLYPIRLADWDTPGFAQSVTVSGKYAYVADQAGGVRILDVENPAQPFEVASIGNIGIVLDVEAAQNLIYIARGSEGLDIYDISDLAKPALKGHYDAGGLISQITLLPENRALLLVSNRAVQVVGLGDPGNIILLGSHDFGLEITQAILDNKTLYVAQKQADALISKIKDDGTIEVQANISSPSNTLGVAIWGNIVYLAKGIDGVQAFNIEKLDKVRQVALYPSGFWKYKITVASLTFLGLLLWLAFFAQFVLPVQTFRQRQKIFDRLITYLLGGHGPAIFGENGRLREREGERMKKGPGVIWLDTASAAVTRSAVRFMETIGPGVHFTENYEYLAGTVDLHTQVDTLGPNEKDKPFDKKSEDQSDDEYKIIQERRKMTSALTRDGIEIVPNVSVTFRVDTEPAAEGQPGSRFGYRTGISRKDRENESKDKEAIRKAIAGEGINPYIPTETPSHRVAWNQLPGRLAVDLWREYVAKFTLDELFDSKQELPAQPPAPPKPEPEETEAMESPIRVSPGGESMQDVFTGMLRVLNRLIINLADRLEGKPQKEIKKPRTATPPPPPEPAKPGTVEMKTAMQVISEMVKARLSRLEVPYLDDTGKRGTGTLTSYEYQLLQRRGLKVLNVSISNLRFLGAIEKQLIDQWTASWLDNAKAERARIERQRGFAEVRGQEQAANKYPHSLARHIMKQRPANIKEALKALLMRTRLEIVRNDQLQRRMTTERQDLDDILQWVEK